MYNSWPIWMKFSVENLHLMPLTLVCFVKAGAVRCVLCIPVKLICSFTVQIYWPIWIFGLTDQTRCCWECLFQDNQSSAGLPAFTLCHVLSARVQQFYSVQQHHWALTPSSYFVLQSATCYVTKYSTGNGTRHFECFKIMPGHFG
jgi:hypothetical protein